MSDLRHIETDALLGLRSSLVARIAEIDRELEARGQRPKSNALGRPRGKSVDKLFALLKTGPAHVQQIKEATGQRYSTALQMCSTLVRLGDLRRVKPGTYALSGVSS